MADELANAELEDNAEEDTAELLEVVDELKAKLELDVKEVALKDWVLELATKLLETTKDERDELTTDEEIKLELIVEEIVELEEEAGLKLVGMDKSLTPLDDKTPDVEPIVALFGIV